jgi:hypothetical protein
MNLRLRLGDYTLVLGEGLTLMMIVCTLAALLWILIFAKARGTKPRLLLLLVPIVAICAPISSCIVETILYPVEAAEIAVPDSDQTLSLEFYGVLDWNLDSDSGRYLVLKDGNGTIRQRMTAFDWIHWPRTSVYLTGDGRIAVLGPTYDDYVVDPKRRTIEDLRYGTASDTWAYFGAFDFKDKYKELKFIPASEQRECTPTRGMTDASATRPQGRFDRCHQEELKY